MRRVELQGTPFAISPIGLGGWQIGGASGRLGWPSQDDVISVSAVHAAVDAGINWIDTAPIYGFGRSEEVIGRAIRSLTEPPLVFTKCGLVWDDEGQQRCDLSPASIRAEVEASLRRLSIDTIDLLQIHWPIPDASIADAWECLVELRDAGLVRAIGVSNFTVDQMQRIAAREPIATLQPPFSLLDRRVEDAELPYCLDRGIGVIVYSPLASGMLGGTLTRKRLEADPSDWRHHDALFQEPHLSEHLAFVDGLATFAARRGIGVRDVAIAWTLAHPAVCGAIVGISRPPQVAELLNAAELVLTRDELHEIDALARETLVSPLAALRLVPPE